MPKLAAIVVSLLLVSTASGSELAVATTNDVPVPMRDGVILRADVKAAR